MSNPFANNNPNITKFGCFARGRYSDRIEFSEIESPFTIHNIPPCWELNRNSAENGTNLELKKEFSIQNHFLVSTSNQRFLYPGILDLRAGGMGGNVYYCVGVGAGDWVVPVAVKG